MCRLHLAISSIFFPEDDIKAALQRRGPHSLGTKDVYAGSKCFSEGSENCAVESFVEDEGLRENSAGREFSGELRFIGATLQLRGVNPVFQPLMHLGMFLFIMSLGKCCSCISHVDSRSSCCSGMSQDSVPELLSRIKGPWSLIYWQVYLHGHFKNLVIRSRCVWKTKSPCSLANWPSSHDSRLLLFSVSPTSLHLNYEFYEKRTIELLGRAAMWNI